MDRSALLGILNRIDLGILNLNLTGPNVPPSTVFLKGMLCILKV